MKQNRRLNMGKSQDKLKEELRQLCDEEKYYEAARLLVLIEDAEDIDFLVERLAQDWLWNLKDVDDETWSYAFFRDGFCNEFGAYGWRDSNMPLAVYNYRRSYELGNRYAAVRLAACYEKGVPDNSEKEKWLLKAYITSTWQKERKPVSPSHSVNTETIIVSRNRPKRRRPVRGVL